MASCNKDVFDDYYARPEGLEDPIYQQLEARGNFKSLTALIGKAKYKDILSKSGYWTMMAPNDEAFAKFFQENGFADASKVDSITAAKIVRYALIYNAFRIINQQQDGLWTMPLEEGQHTMMGIRLKRSMEHQW